MGVKDIMDAKEFLLLNGEDTITRSASPKFYFIPSKGGKQEYHIPVVDPFDKATSNEMISTNKYKVVCKDGYMIISNATSERLVISNVSGQILVNKTISSDMEQVLVPRNSILFVTIGKETIKTISR